MSADLPADAITAANEALSKFAERHGMTFLSMYPTHISKAVIAAVLPALTAPAAAQEREACAQIAEVEADWPTTTEAAAMTARRIAGLIRRRKP